MSEELINEGNNLNLRGEDGKTPLMVASNHGDINEVKLLISKGVNLDIQSFDGWTALMYAAYDGHTDIVEFLADKGSNLNLQNKHRRTAIMLAAMRGHTDIVEFLTDKGANLNLKDRHGRTVYALAAKYEIEKNETFEDLTPSMMVLKLLRELLKILIHKVLSFLNPKYLDEFYEENDKQKELSNE